MTTGPTPSSRFSRRRRVRCRSRGRCCRSPTRPGSSSSRAGWPSSGSSSSRPAGPPGSCRTPGCRCARSPTSPASPRSWTGASRRCIRSSTRACSRSATTRRHVEAAHAHDVEPVDLVCVNLYPFERTAATRGVSDAEVIENIDIGGPTMIRAAAKNFALRGPGRLARRATTRCSTSCAARDRRLSLQTRESLAAEAFAYTARYDTAIARWFQERDEDFPPLMVRAFERVLELPYGENPHQRAAYYTQIGARTHVLSHGRAARRQGAVVQQPARPRCRAAAAGGVRGAGLRDRQAQQPVRRRRSARPRSRPIERAFACDPTSAFGGVICLNRRVDRPTRRGARTSSSSRCCSRAASTTTRSRCFADKPNMRILDDRERRAATTCYEPALRQVIGGLLVQDRDARHEDRDEMQVVSERRPTDDEWQELLFAWRVCKHVTSNAIVLARDGATIGIGAGQMSRVDSVRIAIEKAQGPLAGRGDGLGRVLPVPRRAGARARRGHHRDHPAGRLGPRPARWSRRSTRAGAAMVFTEPAPLPPLRPCGCSELIAVCSEQPQMHAARR